MFLKGFEGDVHRCRIVNSETVAVSTNFGLFIYDISSKTEEPVMILLWEDNFEFDSFSFNSKTNCVFVLDKSGQVKTTKLEKGAPRSHETMNIFVKAGCSSMLYSEHFSSFLMLDKNGFSIWSVDPSSKTWKLLFKVLFIFL